MAAHSEPRPQVRYFDTLAERFDRYAEITDGELRPWLTQVIPDRAGQGSRAVDLGCGNGRFTGLLADRHDEVLAVDIATRQVEIARAKRVLPNISYENRDLREVTPERDGLFDLVLSVNTVNHLRDHDNVLRHIRGLAAPGGHAVLVDIVHDRAWCNTRWWHYLDAVRISAKTLVRRRSAADSIAVLKLRWHNTWITHVTTNIPLSREEFHRRYGTVFSGATFVDHLRPVTCAMLWQAPLSSTQEG